MLDYLQQWWKHFKLTYYKFDSESFGYKNQR